jgi:hypothetical protein
VCIIELHFRSWEKTVTVSEKRQNTRFLELQNVEVRDCEEIKCGGDALKPDIFSEGTWKKTLVTHKENTHNNNNAPPVPIA